MTTPNAPTLSAIVLGYRAGESLVRVLEPLYAELEAEGVPFELVVVANYWAGANDVTPTVAEKFAGSRANVRVIARPKEGAMGWDLRSGLAAAAGSWLVAIDGDAQNPVHDLIRAYRLLRDTGADVVKGRRTERHDGLYRRSISLLYNVFFVLLFGGRGLWDINGKPKGFSRGAYEQLDLGADDWFIDAEVIIQARERGLRIVELPVVFLRNDERASLVKPAAIFEFVRNMIQFRLRAGKRP